MNAQPQLVLSVGEVNRLARQALERNLPSCWIKGEISNLSRATSGHWYFSIKDATASARCVMFRARNQFVDWPAREGEQIEVRAQPSLYEPRGDFQLIVEAMRKAGRGDLFEAYLRLKEKLQLEGLFEADRKRPIPRLPQCIGVITSPLAAALRDVLITLRQRWPLANIVIYPCQVQGDAAPAQILQATQEANTRSESDVLLLVRGGGNLEDLWAFNDEQLARAIAASTIPVISGIGHETDSSIADFVADLRAPTPTGAAQLATPDCDEWRQRIDEIKARLTRRLRSHLASAWQQHNHLHQRLRHPHERLQHQHRQLAQLSQRLIRASQQQMDASSTRLLYLSRSLVSNSPSCNSEYERLQHAQKRLMQGLRHQQTQHSQHLINLGAQLRLLCPTRVLERGYSIVRTIAGEVVTDSTQVRHGQLLGVELAHGLLGVEVKESKCKLA